MAVNNLINTTIPVTVSNGGTGDTSLTAYGVLCGGTTSTSAVQSVAVGTAGYVLTSNGAGALPSMQASGAGTLGVVTQVFTSSGTYTPTTGMTYCIGEAQAGGGGAGGCSSSAGSAGQGAGGGGGGYARSVLTASDIGASKAVTIGAGGTGGAAGNNNGNAGGTTSLGTLLVAAGGAGGTGMAGTTGAGGAAGGAGGTVSAGQFQVAGQSAAAGVVINGASGLTIPSVGGSSQLGRGGANYLTSQGTGQSGTGYGSGGAGAYGTSANQAGGDGKPGIVIITEFVATASVAIPWTNVATSTQALAVSNGYMTNNGASLVTYTLPVTAAQGTEIKIAGYSSGKFTIAQNAGQSIQAGINTTTVGTGGSLAADVASCQVTLLCLVANTTWVAFTERGNFTVT